tara:strand:+ start:41 stop:268 length:228 start_codon:yes stop_codon:yes gene_type:complete
MSTINPNAFERGKGLKKKEVSDAPQDGDTKTERGVKFTRKNGKWVKQASKTAVYKVKKAKKPGTIVDRSKNTAYS